MLPYNYSKLDASEIAPLDANRHRDAYRRLRCYANLARARESEPAAIPKEGTRGL
jgi:hypothetical protein